MEKQKKSNKKKWLKRIAIVMASLFIIFIAIILFIRSEWGQNIIVSKAVNYLQEKTQTEVNIDKLYVTFGGNVLLEGLYVEDKAKDTLLYSESLEASIGILPLIRGSAFELESLDWSGVRATIEREEGKEDYNFQFLIDAFVTADTTQVPTSESEGMDIVLGDIMISDIQAVFNDGVLGIQSKYRIGSLETEVDLFDLDSMHFEVDEFHLKDTKLHYKQFKPLPVSEDTTEVPLPKISVGELSLQNVSGIYDAPVDQLFAKTKIVNLELQESSIDLSLQSITSEELVFSDSNIFFKSMSAKPEVNSSFSDSTQTKPVQFTWPEWTIESESINIDNSDIVLQFKENIENPTVFDPEFMKFKDLTIISNQLKMKPGNIFAMIENISFTERSGATLKELSGNFEFTDTQLKISSLQIGFDKSSLSGDMIANYQNVNQLINDPNKVSFNLKIPQISFHLDDLYTFQPVLEENPYINSIAQKKITGQVVGEGTMGDFSVKNTKMLWGNETQASVAGRVRNVTQPDSLFFSVENFTARTSKSDFSNLPIENSLPVVIPDSVFIKGTAEGTLSDLIADLQLKSSNGDVQVVGSFQNENNIAFDGELTVKQLELQKLLDNPQLGALSLKASVSGNGSSVNTLDATLTSDIQQFNFNGYDFSSLVLNGELQNGKGDINARFKDENLNLKLNTAVVLDSVSPQFDATLKVIGADLNGLGITQKVIKTQFDANAFFKGNAETFDSNLQIDNATLVYDQDPYTIDPITIKGSSDISSTEMSVKSGFLNGNLKANAGVQPIIKGIQDQLQHYLSQQPQKDTITNPILVNTSFTFKEAPFLSEVLVPGLKDSDSLKFSASFDQSKEQLIAEISAPLLKYQEGTIDSLIVDFEGNKNKLNFRLHWDGINYDPIQIRETEISGEIRDKKLYINLDSFDETGTIAHLQSEVSLEKEDSLDIHINPESLLLDRTPWSIKETNKITISKKEIYVDDFVLSKDDQRIQINSDEPGIQKDHVHINLQNFDLANFTSYLNPDEALAGGTMSGDITFEEPTGNTGIIADMSIRNLEVTEVPLGDLTLEASSIGFKNYDLDLGLKGKNVELQLTGDYKVNEKGAQADLQLNLKRLEMALIEGFTDDFISKPSGSLSGKANINGSIAEPNYSGDFHFNKTSFLVEMLNTTFILPEENIKINNKGVFLDQFTITDPDAHALTLDGSIATEDFTNPKFNLKVNAKQFRLINATKEDNELFYGTVNTTADLTLKGDLNVPKVRGSLKVDEDSNFTLVVPETELQVREREGVVLFVNRKNPDAILTRVEDNQAQVAMIKGFDINTKLSVGKKSIFKIVIDERTGDHIQVRGSGDFEFGMDSGGRMNLSGRYDIADGQYKVSLYNLVKREFDIAPSSSIRWNGDPLGAELDVKAIYKVEANPAPIMISDATSTYTRDLDFLVYLNVDGALLEPEISFAMDMPEDQQALSGGAVYGRIQQLNGQESELNKQVFSLLVFNRFFTATGSSGSSGGPASIARDNVNKVLSGQLNNFSDKIIGKTGVDLNFELDSYDSRVGNTASTTTELEINAQKKLLNDRLIVQVGSSVNVEGTNQADEGGTPVIGNVNLQYLLTEDGKYRLKAFRKNEFESVIDGQLIVTGIAFIFNREFNKFRELWTKTAREIEREERRKEQEEFDKKVEEGEN